MISTKLTLIKHILDVLTWPWFWCFSIATYTDLIKQQIICKIDTFMFHSYAAFWFVPGLNTFEYTGILWRCGSFWPIQSANFYGTCSITQIWGGWAGLSQLMFGPDHIPIQMICVKNKFLHNSHGHSVLHNITMLPLYMYFLR